MSALAGMLVSVLALGLRTAAGEVHRITEKSGMDLGLEYSCGLPVPAALYRDNQLLSRT